MWVGIGCLGIIVMFFIISVGAKNDNSVVIWFGIFGIMISSFSSYYLEKKRERDKEEKIIRQNYQMSKSIKSELDLAFNKLKRDFFYASQEAVSADLSSMIAIDEDNKKIAIIYNTYDNKGLELSQALSRINYTSKIFNYDDILQSEIIEDGATVTRTSRSDQLGGALLGGLIAGGVGAVIGGLSAATASSTQVGQVQLQIVVNDSQKSFYRITFGSFDQAVPKSSLEYKKVYDDVLHWHNILSYLIKNVNKVGSNEDEANDAANQASNHHVIVQDVHGQKMSLADELLKLSELVKQGVITQEEYEKLKLQLIK
ncbi:SHOCT domain-containing protein [Paenibacillus campinasensis]|uniref:SHOCT domain-containing protein n=1 Tax=Paenibacillus campinasensis TaxID=66347 RepID=A0A268EWT7_9BACL|nr:SHOCT domain-containing protein [Paenibacillus campinasensis]PAD77592.1 hypothetical protein CHH67_08990 [Paenibacillus campinasensis]